MKILTVCSSPYTSINTITRLLDQAGLALGGESDNHQTYQQWHTQVFDAYEQDMSGLLTEKALSPGKVWQNMASELIYANLDKKQWYWSDSKAVWLLDFWHELEPQHRFALIYSPPQLGISQAILHPDSQDTALEIIINSWIHYHTELLTFYHQHKGKCILVNFEQCLANPNEFISLCQQSFAFNFDKTAITPELKSNCLQSLETELFSVILKQHPQIDILYQELTASATIFPKSIQNDSIEPKEQAVALWDNYKNTIQALKDNARLNSQNPKELDTLKEKITALTEQRKILETQQEQKTTTLQNKINEYQEKSKESESENELMLLQLHQVQEELETHFLKSQSLEKQKADKSKEIEQKIKALEADKTALNKQKEQEKSTLQNKINEYQEKSKESESENELMLLQLHQVQEELEHYFLKYQELENNTQDKPILGLIAVELSNTLQAQVIQVKQTSFGLNIELINLQSPLQLWENYQLTLIKSSFIYNETTLASIKLPLQKNNLLPLQTWPPQTADENEAYWLIDQSLLEKELTHSYLHPDDIYFLHHLTQNLSSWLKEVEENNGLQNNSWDEYYNLLNNMQINLNSITKLHK